MCFQDPHIPASQRCRYQTNKEATGPFDRQKLLDYLHNKAINEEDWAQNKPFVKETRGDWGAERFIVRACQ